MDEKERDEKIASSGKALDEAEASIATVNAVGTENKDERSSFSEVASYLHKELIELRKHFRSLVDERFSEEWTTEYLAFESHFNEFQETLHKELKAAENTRLE